MAPPALVGLVFDLDGTLVDSAPDLWRHTNRVLAEAGRSPLDRATVTSFVGEGATELLRRAFAATGAPLDPPALAAVSARYASIYAEEPVIDTAPMPFAAAVVRALPVPLAVCTNKPERVARAVLAALGLADRFVAVVGGDTLPQRKPDPAPLRAAAAALGLAPTQVALVGDSEIDAATASAAGARFWWYTRGYHRRVPEPVAAAFDDWRQLPSLLAAALTSG